MQQSAINSSSSLPPSIQNQHTNDTSSSTADVQPTITNSLNSISNANTNPSSALVAAQTPLDTPSHLSTELKFVRSVEGVDEYSMENGLHILLVPDASKPTTTVDITYRVGSRYENYGETGMAHLLEHLMFKGSEAHPKLWEELAQQGVRFNGTTGRDRTHYYETFAANPKTLAWAIAMEADRMVNSRISGEDLKSEFSVVLNEMERGENDPMQILRQRVTAAAYPWHNYGKSTIGARSDIENVNIPHLQAFWRKYYQPDNATLIVSGDFDVKSTTALIAEHFGKIPKPERMLEITYTLDPAQEGEIEVVLRRRGDYQALVALYHTVPAAHEDYAALQALTLILADKPNGRLYKALVDDKKATHVSSYCTETEEPGAIVFNAELRTEQNIAEAKQILLDIVEGLAKQPITNEELTRAKAVLAIDIARTYNDPEKLALQLSQNVAIGDWRLFFLLRDRIQALSVTDVERVAATWLKNSNRTVGSFLPTTQPNNVPAPRKVNVAEQIQTFTPGIKPIEAERFVATPENINQRTEVSQLSNGMKLALLPKTTRGSTIALNFLLNIGNLESLQGKITTATLAAAMLRRGTENLNYQQLTEELDRLKTRLSISGSASWTHVQIETVKESLPRILELLGDMLRRPAFSENDFTQIVNERLMQLEASRQDPQAIAIDLLYKQFNVWPKEDPRYYRDTEEKIEQLKAATLAASKDFWQEHYGSEHAEMSLVGDFDPVEVKEALQKQFGDWHSKQAFQRLPTALVANQPKALSHITPDKANAFFSARMTLPLSDHHPDYPAMLMANYLLGGSANSRLFERIRQKDGISYDVYSNLWSSSIDETGSLYIQASFAPQNLEKLEIGLREEIEKAIQGGFSDTEMQMAKEGVLKKIQLQRSQDTSLAGQLRDNLYLDRTMSFIANLEKEIAELSVTTVNAALAKYISYDKLVTAIAGDFK